MPDELEVRVREAAECRRCAGVGRLPNEVECWACRGVGHTLTPAAMARALERYRSVRLAIRDELKGILAGAGADRRRVTRLVEFLDYNTEEALLDALAAP